MDPAAFDSTEFVLNAYDGAQYVVMRYIGRDTVPVGPIISRQNNGGASDVAWPSAFKSSGSYKVFASRFTDGKWQDVALWISADGTSYNFRSVVFSANSSEPHGIGPAQVFYVAGDPRPWRMVYAVRNVNGTADTINMADSLDGISWVRRGPVLSATATYEAGGVCPAWVTRTSSGAWAMFYHAYTSNLSTGFAVVATSDSVNGPFTNKVVIYEPNGAVHAVTGGLRLNNFATVSGTVALGELYIIRRMTGGGLQVIVPTRQVGTTVYFDEPLQANYGEVPSEMAHISRKKVDPSYVYELPDGSWRGIFTGYGHWPGLTTEYTMHMTAPAMVGPWTIVPGKTAFNSWNLSSLLSAENPVPVVNLDE